MNELLYKQNEQYTLAARHDIRTSIVGLEITDSYYDIHRDGMVYVKPGFVFSNMGTTPKLIRASMVATVFARAIHHPEQACPKTYIDEIISNFKSIAKEDGAGMIAIRTGASNLRSILNEKPERWDKVYVT